MTSWGFWFCAGVTVLQLGQAVALLRAKNEAKAWRRCATAEMWLAAAVVIGSLT